MATRITYLCVCLLLLLSACTQTKTAPQQDSKQETYRTRQRWGFVGRDGKEIPCIFDQVNIFWNGYACVKYRGKMGIIDTTGRFIIPPEYKWVEGIRHGIAKVWKQEKGDSVGKAAFVDTANHPVPAPSWWDLKWYYVPGAPRLSAAPDSATKVRLDAHRARYDSVFDAMMRENAWAAKHGGVIRDPTIYMPPTPLLSDRYGYVDSTGKFVIPPTFVQAREFSDGLAWVAFDTGRAPMACIDTTGTVVIPPRSDGGELFVSGRCPVRRGDLTGYIDRTGRLVIPPRYVDAGYFNDGRAVVSLHGRFGMIDTSGSQIVPCIYEKMDSYGHNSNGRTRFCFGGKWGYLDRKGGIAIWPQFDDAESFHEGLAIFSLNDRYGKKKFGVVDTTGKWIAPPIYDQAFWSYGGLVPVCLYRTQ